MTQSDDPLITLTTNVLPEIIHKANNIEQQHLLYGKNVGSWYDSVFQSIGNGDLCNLTSLVNSVLVNSNNCQILMGGVLTQGLLAGLTNIKDAIVYELGVVNYYRSIYSVTNSTLYAKLLIEEGNSQNLLYLAFLYPDIGQPLIQYLLSVFSESINSYVDSEATIQLVILLIFLGLVVFYQIMCGIVLYIENQKVIKSLIMKIGKRFSANYYTSSSTICSE